MNLRKRMAELQKLGLDSAEALQLLHRKLQQARHSGPENCPHCGEKI